MQDKPNVGLSVRLAWNCGLRWCSTSCWLWKLHVLWHTQCQAGVKKVVTWSKSVQTSADRAGVPEARKLSEVWNPGPTHHPLLVQPASSTSCDCQHAAFEPAQPNQSAARECAGHTSQFYATPSVLNTPTRRKALAQSCIQALACTTAGPFELWCR